MVEGTTVNAKYVFLDVVQFTQRTVEAQSDVIKKLNEIVLTAIRRNNIKRNKRILLSTGDGICIVIKENLVYDIDMLIALDILQQIDNHNRATKDAMRIFGVRIGINENTDNLIVDINGKENIAGSGINFANRIMNQSSVSQILISGTVHERLKQREKYKGLFKDYIATIKHGHRITVYQYIKSGLPGLNVDTPEAFLYKPPSYKLTKKIAYYFAHALKNKAFLVQKTGKSADDYYVSVPMLWFLAEDSESASSAKDFDQPILRQPGQGKLSIAEQFELFNRILSIHFWTMCELASQIIANSLDKYYSAFFENTGDIMKCWFVINKTGQNKLKEEYPGIWREFDLDKYI